MSNGYNMEIRMFINANGVVTRMDAFVTQPGASTRIINNFIKWP